LVGGLQVIFCVRNGSGCAEKGTSVSPCPAVALVVALRAATARVVLRDATKR